MLTIHEIDDAVPADKTVADGLRLARVTLDDLEMTDALGETVATSVTLHVAYEDRPGDLPGGYGVQHGPTVEVVCLWPISASDKLIDAQIKRGPMERRRIAHALRHWIDEIEISLLARILAI